MLQHLLILIFSLSSAKQINHWSSQPYKPRILIDVKPEAKILELKLLNLQNIYYSAKIQLGSSKETLNFIIDTGSSTFWVASTECQQCPKQGLYNLYNCTQKEQCQRHNVDISIDYGVGSVNGTFVTSLAQIDGQSLQIDHLLVDHIQDLPDFMASGLIGLGKKIDNNPTMTELLFEAGVIPSPEFSLYLAHHSCQEQSVLSLGGSREALYKGDLNYAASNNSEYWSVKFQVANLVREDKKETLRFVNEYLLIDSGTTKITLPQIDINTLIKSMDQEFNTSCTLLWGIKSYKFQVGQQPLQGMECAYHDDINDYPNVTFILQSVNDSPFQLILTPSIYLDKCYFSFWSLGLRCLTNFQQMDGPEIILGVSFMQNYYTNFNIRDQTIGFAQVKETTSHSTRDFIYKSMESYISVIAILIVMVSCLCFLYCLGKAYIYSQMDLYASVLEKSSSRSDREQELSNLKQKSAPTQQTVSSFPESSKQEFREISSNDENEQ